MSLETGSYIGDLNAANPPGTDPKSQGDDHIRLIKTALKDCFPGVAGAIIADGVDGGLVNAYTVTPSNALLAYAPGMFVIFSPIATNTGTSTINISALGATPLRQVHGAETVAGDLVAGYQYVAQRNAASEFRLIGPTKNYIDQLAFGSALPAQPGDAVVRKLKTVSGVASWDIDRMIRSPRTADTILGLADNGTLIDYTSGTFTQTFTAAATLGAGWTCVLQNSGTGFITLGPSQLIDGLASFVMYPGEIRRVYVEETGTAFKSYVMKGFFLKSLVNFNHVWPPGYAFIDVDLVGGAGGAGSGSKGAVGQMRPGGQPGGAPGRARRRLAGIAPGTVTVVTVGAAGASGAAQTVDSTNGINGTAGLNSTFGSFLTAFGGAAGLGGSISSLVSNVTGSGSMSSGASSFAGVLTDIAGGLPAFATPVSKIVNSLEEGGGGVSTNQEAGNTVFGGAAATSGDMTANTNSYKAGSSQYGAAAGGLGAWIQSGGAASPGAPAGRTGSYTANAGAAGGTSGTNGTAGANGAAAGASDFDMGNPGGGGGACTAAGANVAGNGGNGTAPGGAGGGGGAAINGSTSSGAGGISQPGRAIIYGTPA